MLVKKLIIENFKGTAKRTVNLDSECTLISGNMRTGKTTIGEAIPFALYGVTLDGSPRCDSLVLQGTKKAVVAVTVQVNGANHIIERTKTRKGTEVTLDGVEAAQGDVDNLIGFSGKEFMAMYNPLHILKMEPTKARAFFMSLLETPAEEDVLKELLSEHQGLLKLVPYLRNPDLALEQHRKELKAAEEEATGLSGAMSEVKEQIDIVKNELLNCTKPDEQEIVQLKGKIEGFQIPAEPQQPDGSELKILESKVITARTEYKSLSEQKHRLLQQYPPKPSDKCPTCSQDIPAGMMAGVLKKWEEQAEKVNQLVSEVDQKLWLMSGEGKKLAEQLEIEQKAFSLKTTLYKAALQGWESSTEATRNTHKAYTEGLRRMQEKQTNYNNLVDRKESLEKRLIEKEVESKDYQQVIKQLNQVIETIKEYRFKAVELQMKVLKPHLKHVDVTLFEIVKSTGEIKPAFTLTYDGKPASMFSRSEETLAGLEIALLVQKLRGVTMPVFIDNIESFPNIELSEEPQYILVKVVSGQDLCVEPTAKNWQEVA